MYFAIIQCIFYFFLILQTKNNIRRNLFFPVILGELYKTDVHSVTIINYNNLHKKPVDTVHNLVYKSLFPILRAFSMWITFSG